MLVSVRLHANIRTLRDKGQSSGPPTASTSVASNPAKRSYCSVQVDDSHMSAISAHKVHAARRRFPRQDIRPDKYIGRRPAMVSQTVRRRSGADADAPFWTVLARCLVDQTTGKRKPESTVIGRLASLTRSPSPSPSPSPLSSFPPSHVLQWCAVSLLCLPRTRADTAAL